MENNNIVNDIERIVKENEVQLIESNGRTFATKDLVEIMPRKDVAKEIRFSDLSSIVEIVELDEVAEFYRTQKLNAYKEQLNDFAFMEDRLDELSRMIESYIDEAKKAYKEE